MLKLSIPMMLCCLVCIAATAQKTVQVTPQPAMPPQQTFAYKKINRQLEYAFILNKPGNNHPKEGDQIMVNMQSVCNNRMMYSTSIANKGKPALFGVAKPSYKGDLIEAIVLMTPGDSIVCLTDADSLFKNAKNKMPPFIKHGDKVQYFIKLVSIKPKEQVMKEQQAQFMKMMKEQETKQKAAAAKQMVADDKALKAYFAKHSISPTKTASGMYYLVTQEGSGEKPLPGDNVTMNYTGTLLDGTKFDSNVDTAFKHTQPFQFALGRGAVIKGWDEGVALLKTGSKATLYIPSPLAYGPQARPGGGANPKGIPANSSLVFDVELVSATHPAPPPPPPALKSDSLKMESPKMDSIKTDVPKVDSLKMPEIKKD